MASNLPIAAKDATLPVQEPDVSVKPLQAEDVWPVVERAFADFGYFSEYLKAKRGFDEARECFWLLIAGVKPHEMDLILQRIGERLETDFSMVCDPGAGGGESKFLVSINAWQNLTSEETDAAQERIEDWEALRLKCARR